MKTCVCERLCQWAFAKLNIQIIHTLDFNLSIDYVNSYSVPDTDITKTVSPFPTDNLIWGAWKYLKSITYQKCSLSQTYLRSLCWWNIQFHPYEYQYLKQEAHGSYHSPECVVVILRFKKIFIPISSFYPTLWP